MANKETKRKKKYEPKTGKKGGALTKKRRLEVLDKIQDEYLRYGHVNKSKLARELKISRPTMISLINDMNIEMESLPTIKLELKLIFERIKTRLMYLWDYLISQAETDPDKLNIRQELAIMKEIKDTIDNFYSMLQEFGEAPKQAENINIKEEKVQLNINLDINDFSQIKELESRRG
jgi:hypothetical protein